MKSVKCVKLSQEELELVSGGYNFSNCNFHDFSQAATNGAFWGVGLGARGGVPGVIGGAAGGAFVGGSAYLGTCWW